MSNRVMSAPLADWSTLIGRIEAESDVIIPFEGIPDIMSGVEFNKRYGEIGSPRYEAQLGRIEAQIDALGLYSLDGLVTVTK